MIPSSNPTIREVFSYAAATDGSGTQLFVRGDSADADALRQLLAATGVRAEGGLEDLVRAFQSRYNAGLAAAAEPLKVDGLAGPKTLAALQQQLRAQPLDNIVSNGTPQLSPALEQFLRIQPGVPNLNAPLPGGAVSGADLATAMRGSSPEQVARKLLEQHVSARRVDPSGLAEINGPQAAAQIAELTGLNGLPPALPNALDETAIDEAAGAPLGVGATGLAFAAKRALTASADPVRLTELPAKTIGRDVHQSAEELLKKANGEGRPFAYRFNDADLVARPGDKVDDVVKSWEASTKATRAAKETAVRANRVMDDTWRKAVNDSLRKDGIPTRPRPGETIEEFKGRVDAKVADRAAIHRAQAAGDQAVERLATDPKAAQAAANRANGGTKSMVDLETKAWRDAINETLAKDGVAENLRLKPGETIKDFKARVDGKVHTDTINRAATAGEEAVEKLGAAARNTVKTTDALVDGAKIRRAAMGSADDAAKAASFGSRALKGAGKIAVPVGLALDTYDVVTSAKADEARGDGKHTERNKAFGRAGGGWLGGMAAGAALGTLGMPVVGTVVGAIGGAIVGSIGGEWLMSKATEARSPESMPESPRPLDRP